MITTRIVAALWLTGVVTHAGETGSKITVSLRFAVADRLSIGPRARYLAGRMFAGAGLDVEWVDGAEGLPGVIPVVLSGATVPSYRPRALAYAEPHEGGHIRVFLDRVETYQNPAVVLAHVLVHEITHVIQGTTQHSETGVMKARWDSRDYLEMWHRPLEFTPEDLDRIRQGLAHVVRSDNHAITKDEKGVTR